MADGEVEPGGLTLGTHGNKQPNKLLIAGIAIAGVAVLYIVLKKKSSATAASSSTTASSPSTVIYPSDSTDGTSAADASQYYDSLMTAVQNSTGTTASNIQSGTQAVTSAVDGLSTQIAAVPGQTATDVTSAQKSTPNLPVVQGPNGLALDIVGAYNAARQYTGYEVGNGAPVYADPGGNSTWQLGLPASALTAGTEFATPTQYAPDIDIANKVTNAPPFTN